MVYPTATQATRFNLQRPVFIEVSPSRRGETSLLVVESNSRVVCRRDEASNDQHHAHFYPLVDINQRTSFRSSAKSVFARLCDPLSSLVVEPELPTPPPPLPSPFTHLPFPQPFELAELKTMHNLDPRLPVPFKDSPRSQVEVVPDPRYPGVNANGKTNPARARNKEAKSFVHTAVSSKRHGDPFVLPGSPHLPSKGKKRNLPPVLPARPNVPPKLPKLPSQTPPSAQQPSYTPPQLVREDFQSEEEWLDHLTQVYLEGAESDVSL